MSNPTRSEEDITVGLMALIAWAGNASAAARSLKADGRLNVNASTLTSWAKDRYALRYEELRERYAAQLEKTLVADMREIVAHAMEGERLAIEKAIARLKSGEDQDPGRTAANLARVAQSNTDKILSLSGRPTQITENRDATEILRRLVANGVLAAPAEDSHAQLEAENGVDRADSPAPAHAA